MYGVGSSIALLVGISLTIYAGAMYHEAGKTFEQITKYQDIEGELQKCAMLVDSLLHDGGNVAAPLIKTDL